MWLVVAIIGTEFDLLDISQPITFIHYISDIMLSDWMRKR